MPIKLLRLAIAASTIPLLMSCQTPTNASSSDVAQARREVDDLSRALKQEFCRGQYPMQVTPETYNALDAFSQRYITANNQQFIDAGCKV